MSHPPPACQGLLSARMISPEGPQFHLDFLVVRIHHRHFRPALFVRKPQAVPPGEFRRPAQGKLPHLEQPHRQLEGHPTKASPLDSSPCLLPSGRAGPPRCARNSRLALNAQPRYENVAMKSGSLNVFILYADQETRHAAVYAATSADQAVALHRAQNPTRLEWAGDVMEVLDATADGVPRKLRVIRGSVGNNQPS